ncbi:MAG: hypothetical protein GY861_04645 [bacterium]|nr:hypothetical protein [bacterium]
MELNIPKWMAEEVEKDSTKSVQYTIKEILKEYLRSDEGRKIRKRIREREGVYNVVSIK